MSIILLVVVQGDINEKQKSNTRIENKIEDLMLNCGVNNADHKEKLAVLQQETQTIKDNIQVGPGTITALVALLKSKWLNSAIIGSLSFCQGDQSGAVAIPKEAGRGGEKGPEGEEGQPGGPEVHQAGVGSDGRKESKVRLRPHLLL